MANKTNIPLEYYQLAFDQAPVHFIFTDPDGKILSANPEVKKVTGYSLKEVIGSTPRLWGGQMSKAFYQKLWRTIKTEKKPFHGFITNKRKNDQLYQAEVWISPVLNQKKNFSDILE